MNIRTVTPGIKISEGLLHLIRARLSRLERMFSGIMNSEVTLSKVDDNNHHNYAMEANIVTPAAIIRLNPKQPE
jgi:ribosome-associated translation inhibitor RaiA